MCFVQITEMRKDKQESQEYNWLFETVFYILCGGGGEGLVINKFIGLEILRRIISSSGIARLYT